MSIAIRPESGPKTYVLCGLPAEGDFRAVHPEHAGIPPGCAAGRRHFGARKKTQLHQAPGDIVRQIEAIDNALLAVAEIHQRAGSGGSGTSGIVH